MWQAPNSRSRALASQRRRERERLRRPIHIKRVDGKLTLAGSAKDAAPIGIRVVLNDLSPKGAGIFAPSIIPVGQEISITIEEPKHLSLKGKVTWYQEHDANSHILTQVPFSYRIGIEFIFDTEADKQAAETYCKDILNIYLFGAKAA